MADQGWEQVAAEAAKAVDLLRANNCPACGDAADLIDKMAEQLSSTAAEVARLRGVAELMRSHMSCEQLHHGKRDQHEYEQPCPVIARIDAALTPLAAGEAEGA